MFWDFRTFDEDAVDRLRQVGIPPVLARLLAIRGIATADAADEFLHPSLARLHSPFLMNGMRAALTRLLAAISRQEKILIYGDYDVDGTTAIVVLKTAIELCGGAAEFHVPHRIREGYGMREEVIERAAADGVRLIISVDTGIRAMSAADAAARLGVDVIVTDHHLPEEGEVPRALAVLNPNQAGCEYPCKALCGAGVAFKLAQALLTSPEAKLTRPVQVETLLKSFLKMVAIATVADAVPLTGENRLIAALGLDGLRAPVNAGLKALIEVATVDLSRRLTSADIAFRLAPRLNAAGRMDVARDVVELFSTRDPLRARELAEKLNQLNGERQQEEARIIEEIEKLLAEPGATEPYCLVVDGDGWHRGVIGIAATRVVERHGRPALVIARDDAGEAHGSGRSISRFHLLEALESCRALFTRFGGHAHAVGFSLPSKRIGELRAALDRHARARLTTADFAPRVAVDAELPIHAVTPELYELLRQMEPFGIGNPQPTFAARGARLVLPPRTLKDKHLKLRLQQPTTGDRNSHRSFDAVGWRMAESFRETPLLTGDTLDIAYRVEKNVSQEFGGGLQLELVDAQRSAAATAETLQIAASSSE